MQSQMAAMQHQMDLLKQQLAAIQQAKPAAPHNDTLFDTKPNDEVFNGEWQVGYADGFYIQDRDQFKIVFNGLFDGRYSYVNAENRTSLANTSLGTNHYGDMSGFNLNTGQLAVSGYLFHNIIFKVMGNFGSTASFTSPTAGTFQLTEYWAGYSFSPEFNIRGGTFIVPLVPLRGIANYGGSQFPDPSDATVPFSPGYALGADVSGALLEKTLSYDVLLSNGSNSQNLVDSTVPAAGRDNRLSIYTREQYAGSGKLSDFYDEPDLQDHSDFVWIAGAGVGVDSQNNNANAFPGPQSSIQIPGLSAATAPGFVPTKYTLNGTLYRGALDFRSKYRGWSTFGEVIYQNMHSESGTIIPGSPKSTVEQVGYFLQTGYFLVPHKFDIAARFGELYTLSFPHHMDEYSLGVDYYLYNENMKLQLAETYIPAQAALTSGNGSVVNTQDFITQLQVQIKF